MARIKQTPKWAAGQPRMPRARFAIPDDNATPSTSGTTPSTSGSASQAPKATRTPRRRRAPVNVKHVPPALRITRENANARMTGANAIPQGYYKPEKFQMETWNQGIARNQVLPKIYSLAAPTPAFPASHQRSGTRLQDRFKVHSRCCIYFAMR